MNFSSWTDYMSDPGTEDRKLDEIARLIASWRDAAVVLPRDASRGASDTRRAFSDHAMDRRGEILLARIVGRRSL